MDLGIIATNTRVHGKRFPRGEIGKRSSPMLNIKLRIARWVG